jgi:lysophospholipase L1-like esterase
VLVTAVANAWTEVTVPLSALGYPAAIKRVTIMNFTPDPQPMVTFDEIRFEAISGPLSTLSVGKAGTGFGSVTSWPPGISCGSDCGEGYAGDASVTLTPWPAVGSTFSGWSGACTGSGACTVPMSAARWVTANFTGTTVAGGVRWTGRIDASDPAAVRFAWQGAGFVATVSGSTIAVKLQTTNAPTAVYQVVVDGLPGARISVPESAIETVTLASGLAPGEHVVELYRDTEGMYGVSTFWGFAQGTLVGSPALNGRLVEVVGDAISAGYGNLGSEPHPGWVANPACTWSADNSSWFHTYGSVAGRALGAQVSTVARSGWGLVRDGSGNSANTLPSVYDNAVGTNDPGAWGFSPQASVVVVNLGTGDIATGDPGTAFETAYVDFVRRVRGRYPNAWVFVTIGSTLGEPNLGIMKTRLANVVAALNDGKVVTFDLGTQDLGWDGSVPTGCDWHPSAADHARMAEILKAQLKTRLGW